MRGVAQNAELALLLEVTGTPKPGNVDRHRDFPDLRFEHFMAGAVGAQPGLRMAEEGTRVGRAFERAVAGMAEQSAGNTQFGALLLLVPLCVAATTGRLDPSRATRVVEATSIDDAADFYRAFEHVDVAVDDPPADLTDLDVRRGSEAIPALEARGLSLYDVMALSTEVDTIAREWCAGFPRTFRAAQWLLEDDGPVPDRASRVFLHLLAAEEDTFVRTRNGPEAATEATERAAAVLRDEEDAEALADEFVRRDINPGTTADLVAAALFVALERGMAV
jgi:triphosphoribosyl-dephospho-CoA synthase